MSQRELHSEAAELSVLGAMIIDSSVAGDVSATLTASDFFVPAHRTVYTSILGLAALGKPFDIIALADSLERNGELTRVGGLPWLAAIARDTPSAANALGYAGIVKSHSQRRKLAAAAAAIGKLAAESGDILSALDEAQTILSTIADQSKAEGGPRHIDELLTLLVDDIDRRFKAGGDIVGASTGFSDFDKLTCGLVGGEFWVIGGAPGMGKSTLAANIAEHVAIHERKPVLYWSGEMSSLQVVRRAVAAAGRIDKALLRNGQLSDDDWPRLTSAITKYNGTPFHVDDTPGLTIPQLRASTRQIARKAPLGLVVVDYLQLMRGEGDSRVQEVASVSRGLKRLAVEFDVPVIAVASLNREISKRPNKRPVMADLRECGEIEFDVDVGVFVYRDELYNTDTVDKGIAEIIFRKIREGEPQTIPMRFEGGIGRFEPVMGGMPSWNQPQQERSHYGFDA